MAHVIEAIHICLYNECIQGKYSNCSIEVNILLKINASYTPESNNNWYIDCNSPGS